MWHTVVSYIVLMLGLRSSLAGSWEDCDNGGDRDQVVRACTELSLRVRQAPSFTLEERSAMPHVNWVRSGPSEGELP